MSSVIVKQDSVENALSVHLGIEEFNDSHDIGFFEERLQGKSHIVFVSYVDNEPAGYLIAYDRYEDGSIYCWMTGVCKKFRKKGALTALMNELERWSKENGFYTIKIKTRNKRREMLAFLIKHKYSFTDVQEKESIEENRILLKKKLS